MQTVSCGDVLPELSGKCKKDISSLPFSEFTPRLVKVKNFVCVEVLRPSQPNGVMSSAVSLPNHMFTVQT